MVIELSILNDMNINNEDVVDFILKEFNFLLDEGYEQEVELYGTGICVIYKSKKVTIHIVKDMKDGAIFGDDYYIAFSRESPSIFNFNRDRYFYYLNSITLKNIVPNTQIPDWVNNKNYKKIYSTLASIIQKYFIQVVRGEKWVDDIIK